MILSLLALYDPGSTLRCQTELSPLAHGKSALMQRETFERKTT
jgi:hypothetical protein